jgi:hypothetical protein
VSFERRLSKLETSVSPTEAVLSWLAEAHEFPIVPESFGSLLDGSLLDAPKEAWPLVRIGGQVEASVRAAMKGKTADAVWKAVRRRVGDAFFLFELVIRLNLAAEEILRFEGLRWSTLTLLMRDLSHDTDFGAPPRSRRNDRALPSIMRSTGRPGARRPPGC